MLTEQQVTENDAPRGRDSGTRLNRKDEKRKQPKLLLFKGKQFAANQSDELF
jgi:hypothetical protein